MKSQRPLVEASLAREHGTAAHNAYVRARRLSDRGLGMSQVTVRYTVDHYSPKEARFAVPEGDDARVAALELLAARLRSELGSRNPTPRVRLLVEFK